MPRRYRCLVVDHDDTSVMSTPSIHYPAHVEAMRRLRPGTEPVSLEAFLEKNFDPGFYPFITRELGLSREEVAASYAIWREHTGAAVPPFFPGLLELYAAHKAAGGLLVVVSHSEVPMIERDYRVAGAEAMGAMPDLVFGWDDDEARRKPHPYPLLEAMCLLGLPASELLVVDDLKPGADMAAAAGVDFAAAGWGHSIPSIKSAMLGLCDYYLDRVEDLAPLAAAPSARA
jgi:beta-phosphoglucomutase-like phosphatase (HAD superfamily)